jgi:dUTP pyrophosphatase
MSSTSVYRLELCPTNSGQQYYQNRIFETNENAGFDLYVAEGVSPFSIQSKPCLLDLGTSARMVRISPDGSEEEVHYWLCPRSSIYKTGLMMANSQGVIDRSYRGLLKAPVWVVNSITFEQTLGQESSPPIKGQRLFQIVAPDMGFIKEVRIVTSLPDTRRGAGGFGSTGQT